MTSYKKRAEDFLPGSKEWKAFPHTHSGIHQRGPVGAEFLTDITEPILIAFGIIIGGIPPGSGGHILNWGGLARPAGAGVYTVIIGHNGCPADNSQIVVTPILAVPGQKIISVDSSETVKTFSCFIDGVASDDVDFKFSIHRMPYTS